MTKSSATIISSTQSLARGSSLARWAVRGVAVAALGMTSMAGLAAAAGATTIATQTVANKPAATTTSSTTASIESELLALQGFGLGATNVASTGVLPNPANLMAMNTPSASAYTQLTVQSSKTATNIATVNAGARALVSKTLANTSANVAAASTKAATSTTKLLASGF
jgi:hypothetical protein